MTAHTQTIRERLVQALRDPDSRALTIVRTALVAVLGLLVWYAVEGVKPWETNWAERVAEGKRPGLLDHIRAGTWVAAVINALLVAGLLASSRLWCRIDAIRPLVLLPRMPGRPASPAASPLTPRPPLDRWFLPVLFVILVASAIPRIARFDQSLWGDEEWAFREYVHGEFVPVVPDEPLGKLEFRPTDWRHAFFFDPNANNHYLFSVLQHATTEAWRTLTGAERWEFSEPVTRIVPFVAGLLLLVAAALVARRLAGAGVALLVVAVLAAHPMQIRYASEARGYSMIALITLLVVWTTIRALERGRWRDWSLVGLSSLLALHTWKASAHPVAMIQLVGVAHILLRRPGPPGGGGWKDWLRSEKGVQLTRLVVCNAIAAGAFIQLFAPCQPQVRRALESSMLQGLPMDIYWFLGSLCRIAFGFQYQREDPENPVQIAFQSLEPLHRTGAWLVALALVASAIAGFRALHRQAPWTAFAFAAPVATLPLAWAHFRFGPGVEFRYWYQIYAYAPLFILVAIGLAEFGRRLARRRDGRAAGHPSDGHARARHGLVAAAPALVFVVLFVLVSLPQTMMLVRHPFEDFAGAAAVARGRVEDRYYTGPSRILTLNYWRSAPLYDPRFDTHARSPEALQAVIDRARSEQLDLFVTIGILPFNATFFPEVHRMITESGEFEKLAVFWAEHTMFTLHVFRLRQPDPGS